MGKVKKYLIDFRIKFYSKLLLGFSQLLTPQAFIIFTIYFGEYVLVKFSKEKNDNENTTGANIASEIGKDNFYQLLVNTRNAIVHYDVLTLPEYLRDLSEIDYTDFCPCTADTVIHHCLLRYNEVDWQSVKDYLLKV